MIIPSKSESIYGWKNFWKKFPPIQIRSNESNHQFHHTLYRSPGTHSLSHTRLREPSIRIEPISSGSSPCSPSPNSDCSSSNPSPLGSGSSLIRSHPIPSDSNMQNRLKSNLLHRYSHARRPDPHIDYWSPSIPRFRSLIPTVDTRSSVPHLFRRGDIFFLSPLIVARLNSKIVHKKMNVFVTFFFEKSIAGFWYRKVIVS